MTVKLLTEHHLEFLSLIGGCRGSSESTHVKIPHCWKSRVTAHMVKILNPLYRKTLVSGVVFLYTFNTFYQLPRVLTALLRVV